MDDVKENPWSEICWYMPESREQYRLSGKLYIIRSDEKDEDLKKVAATFVAAHLILNSAVGLCMKVHQRFKGMYQFASSADSIFTCRCHAA